MRDKFLNRMCQFNMIKNHITGCWAIHTELDNVITDISSILKNFLYECL